MSYNSSRDSLNIMHWNDQGITTPIAKLEQVLIQKQMDVFLLNETFLKPNHKFKLVNYKIYREGRQTHGGGVLKYTNSFVNNLDIMTRETSDFLFLMINAHHTSWNCQQNNIARNSLYNHQLNSDYYDYTPDSFTRFGQSALHTQPSVVDIILSNYSLHISEVNTYPELLNSYHIPITCKIHGSIIETMPFVLLSGKANWK